ncbi:MAG: hypothetical protein AAF570_27155, partial [Bacteroidota bacterium]
MVILPQAGARYQAVFDPYYTPKAMGENLLTLHRVTHQFLDRYLPTKWTDESTPGKKLGGIAYRLGKLVTLDFLLDYFLVVGHHEVFGHGFRFRQAGFSGNAYNVVPPPPLGPWGGFAQAGTLPNPWRLGIHDRITIQMGGSEGTQQIAHGLRNKWMSSGQIRATDALLYLMAFHDMTAYILSTRDNTSGGDPANYIRFLNIHHNHFDLDSLPLGIPHLRRYTLLNFANTFSLLSLYHLIHPYLARGNATLDLPGLSIGKWEYLPAVRMGYSPFGIEFYGEHFLRSYDHWMSLYHRIGDGKLNGRWWGFGWHGEGKFFNERAILGA